MQTNLSLKLQSRVTLQTVLTSQLLSLSHEELVQAVLHEARDNPALAPLARGLSRQQPTSFDDEPTLESLASQPTATDVLLSQLRLMIAEDDEDIAIYLIQSLDSHGYLKLNADQVADDLHITPQRAARVIASLRELDPPGIGARDTRDCFLLQCADLESRDIPCDDVRQIVTLAWDDLMHQRWHIVARITQLSLPRIEAAQQFMRLHLYPHPIALIQTTADAPPIVARADLCIRAVPAAEHAAAGFVVEIPAERSFQLLRESELPMNEHTRNFLFALQQRWATLRRLGEAIVSHQSDFLQHGPRHLKPLTRAQLASELSLHESTLSRAVADKFVLLPNGQTRPLAELFDSSCAIKTALSDTIVRAPKPLSDAALARQLHAQGFDVARRTVTKYRNELGLLPRNRPKLDRQHHSVRDAF
jgi:RNA polymerase sigma-54 factor